MRKFTFSHLFTFLAVTTILLACNRAAIQSIQSATTLRAPAYPLVTIDPYTSAWSQSDQLFDSPVRHWTGKTHSLIGALRVDGQVYRFLGKEDIPMKTLLPMASEQEWNGKYMTGVVASGWEKPDYNDSKWESGKAAFGTPGMQSIGTRWDTKEIWVRREFILSGITATSNIYLIYSHDDDFELYLNGTEIVRTGNSAKSNVLLKLDAALLKADGKNVLAAHCLDRGGLAYVDFGIFTDSDQKEVFAQTAVQNSMTLSATQTNYSFTCGPVDLNLQFVAPMLPNDLDLLSRPVNYINYEVKATDGKKHEVQLYFETTPEWAVNELNQEVKVSMGHTANVSFVKAGTVEQPILQKKGDNVRIDWGYLYLATPKNDKSSVGMGNYFTAKEAFASTGMTASTENVMTTKMTQSMPAMNFVDNLGSISAEAAKGYVMIGYDDLESIQYFGTNLRGWWTNDGALTMHDALQSASTQHEEVMERCTTFDNQLWEETLKAGGKNYADLCVLAYRQAIAAHKLTKDTLDNILFLSKENFSNGSIGTVDVTYPSAPLFLKYNPELLKGMLNPIFYYSESGQWTNPFAAHDVGTYPLANGQTYGGDMPVEECGNMLILTAAIAQVEDNADYASKHWDVLTVWANYLLENGLDPENQLCTDDFAGHFAHNTNLSIKAIMGIAGYGKLAAMLGKTEEAEKYTSQAKEMAAKWMTMAHDGDHYRLTFDKPGTWSQKYNLVWDELLDLNIFPREVAQTEIAWYLTQQNKYGLPLDNRRTYTKADWIVWTATMTDDQQTFEKFINPLHDFVRNTPSRVPLTDWYETTDATQVGFQARSVVGGFFIKTLKEKN